MSTIFGSYGPRHRLAPRLFEAAARPLVRRHAERKGLYGWTSQKAQDLSRSFRERIDRGETVYLVGLSPASHNTGVALIECHRDRGLRVLANDEEERFAGEKHCLKFPVKSLMELGRRLEELGCGVDGVHCVLGTWDYADFVTLGFRSMLEHVPQSLKLFRQEESNQTADSSLISQVLRAPSLLNEVQPFAGRRVPIVMMGHHENHAYMAYAMSPFIHGPEPTLIAVLDGVGDAGATSIFRAHGQQVDLLYRNHSFVDSLGLMYGIISSTQGGWTINSSEGRYMGAAAWGDQDRLTNRYYRSLRELVHLAPNGEFFINREMSGWQLGGGMFTPYREPLRAILGDPIPYEKMWNPDAVLNVDDVEHADITMDRVDKAAALQLVFEDALFHVIEHWVRQTGAEQLVLAGGAALNCVANMRLMDQLDERYYERHLHKKATLSIWIPPAPGDAGVPIGAAIQFAMRNGVRPSRQCFPSPYVCGHAPTYEACRAAIALARASAAIPPGCELRTAALGSCSDESSRARLASFMAHVVAEQGVIGIYQGPAETGPRALGNRSILANPCHPDTLARLNAKVKHRERIRPLAPMATREAAVELFELSEGARAHDYAAYDYMILTARAREAARERVPAIVHRDGTSRIQIVRPSSNPLMYAYLKAMGKAVGVEVSVNTSLNVGSPIVQTPEQAVEVLFRAKALDGIIMVAEDGRAVVVWLDGPHEPGGSSFMREWLSRFDFQPAA